MKPVALKPNTVTRTVHFHFFKADRLRLWSVKVQQQLVATQELLVARTEAFVNDDDEAQYVKLNIYIIFSVAKYLH